MESNEKMNHSTVYDTPGIYVANTDMRKLDDDYIPVSTELRADLLSACELSCETN